MSYTHPPQSNTFLSSLASSFFKTKIKYNQGKYIDTEGRTGDKQQEEREFSLYTSRTAKERDRDIKKMAVFI